jgi:hypothetical protein
VSGTSQARIGPSLFRKTPLKRSFLVPRDEVPIGSRAVLSFHCSWRRHFLWGAPSGE